MTNDSSGGDRDPRDCDDGECGSADCGGCQVVCSHCGDEHTDAQHAQGERLLRVEPEAA